MSERFDQLKDYIYSHTDDMVELERILTAIPALAPENGGEGESAKCAALESYLVSHGIKNLTHYDAPDPRVPSGVRPNLVAEIPGAQEGGAVWVCCHLDVVPAGELSLWRSNPWQMVRQGERITGRGVEDNQQGLCSAVLAALSFVAQHIIPERTLKLLFMADEEVGSRYGMEYLLREHKGIFSVDDRILVPDGGDPKGEAIEIAEKSILWLRFTTRGKQTHASRPDQGCNAKLAASYLAVKLNELEEHFAKRDELFSPERSTFQPTMQMPNVSGVNIIPGEDVFCADCRILPCYSLGEVREAIEGVVRDTELRYGVRVSQEVLHAEGSPATAATSPVARELALSIKAAHGIEPRFIGIGGGTVAACLRNAGLDAVVWSTMDETAHQPNEYALIDNIARDAATIAYMVSDAVGGS